MEVNVFEIFILLLLLKASIKLNASYVVFTYIILYSKKVSNAKNIYELYWHISESSKNVMKASKKAISVLHA